MDLPALVPELYVSSLERSLAFYVGLLGFEVAYERPESRFAAVTLGRALLLLEETPSLRPATPDELQRGQWRPAALEPPFGRGVSLQIEVSDVAACSRRMAERAYPLLLPVHARTYRVGTRERTLHQLLVQDPDGYVLRLAQTDLDDPTPPE